MYERTPLCFSLPDCFPSFCFPKVMQTDLGNFLNIVYCDYLLKNKSWEITKMIGLLLGSFSCEPPSCQAPISLTYLFFEPFEFPSSDGRVCLQCGRPSFYPLVGKIPWRRKWLPTHFLAWRIPWTEEPGRLHSMGSQRVGCD